MAGWSERQAALAAWIWAQPGAAPPTGLQAVGGRSLAQGLSAYREHAKALALRALAAVYPELQRWLGEAEFAGLAWAYARRYPPQQGDMNRWGLELADFLDELPDMESEPPALARLEARLHQLLGEVDEREPDADLFATLQHADPARMRLCCSRHLQLMQLPAGLQELAPPADGPVLPPQEERRWVLIWRRGWRPLWTWIDADLAALLDALMQAPNLDAALTQALAAHPGLDLGAALQLAWREGWLIELRAV